MGHGRWALEAVDRLLNFLDLEQDWDSYGAKPIDREVVNCALRFVAWLDVSTLERFDVFPASGGGVMIEWFNGDLSVDFEVDGTITAWRADTDTEFRITGERTKNHLLYWLTSIRQSPAPVPA